MTQIQLTRASRRSWITAGILGTVFVIGLSWLNRQDTTGGAQAFFEPVAAVEAGLDGDGRVSDTSRFIPPGAPTDSERRLDSSPPAGAGLSGGSFSPSSATSPLAPGHTGYANGLTGSTAPTTHSVLETHRLAHVSCAEFEAAIVATWGTNLRCHTQADGRIVCVSLPIANGQTIEMTIDRQQSLLTYSGPAALVETWRRMVATIDVQNRAGTSGERQMVTMGRAEAPTIHHALEVIGLDSNPEDGTTSATGAVRFAPASWAQPTQQENQEGDAPVEGQPPADSSQEPPIVITQEEEPGLRGPVRIEVIEELGIVILSGRPADVAIVKRYIEEIARTADETQPQVEMYQLENASSRTLREMVVQIYDEVYRPRQGPVSIMALDQPNALLVIGPPEAHLSVAELIRRLDTPTPADAPAEFRVFRLRFMSVVDAANRISSYFGQPTDSQAGLVGPQTADAAALPVTVVTDYRSNTLIVKTSARNMRVVEQLLAELDTDDTEATNEVRVFPLRNALAEEMALVLQDAINGHLIGSEPGFSGTTGIGAQQQQLTQQQLDPAAPAHLQSARLQLMAIDPDGRLVKSGILLDVRVTADSNSNSLVVTGPANSMDLIALLIEQLDRLPDIETQIKVFTVQNGDGVTLLEMLQALFTQQGTQGGGAFGQTGTGALLPLQSAGASEGGTLGGLRFSLDQRTNSIIASGSPSDLRVIEALLVRLDESEINMRQVCVYRLSNAPAEDVAAAINEWLAGRRTINTADPAAISAFEQVYREVIVVPELVSNSLIVSATPDYYAELEGVIRALDRRPSMVKIKVLIAEVELNDVTEFGLEAGVQDSLVFDRGIAGTPTVGFPFNQPNIGNNLTPSGLATREDLAGQGLVNLNVGRTNSSLGYGGLVLSAGNESINLLLRALKHRNSLRILSDPHILTVENLQGRVQVGQQVPYVTSSTQTNFGITNSISFAEVGIILQVTPRVSPDGTIVMLVDAVRSNLGPVEQGIPISVSNDGTIIRAPIINTTNAQTTLIARSGQTVVFSGLITELDSYEKRGVPFISDIPWVGPLMSFQARTTTRRELLIILTPYLVESDAQITASNQVEMDRLHWCMGNALEIHGPLGTGPDPELVDLGRPTTYFPDQDPCGLSPVADCPGSVPHDGHPMPPQPPPPVPGQSLPELPPHDMPPSDPSQAIPPPPNEWREATPPADDARTGEGATSRFVPNSDSR